MFTLKSLKPKSIPVIGSVLACLFWFSQSAIDTFVFEQNNLYIESLLRPEAAELWMRFQIVMLLMLFSLLSMCMLSRFCKVKEQLNKYKYKFEYTVEQRTNDSKLKNKILKEEIRERQQVEKKLIQLATIDSLTSIPNRRKFDEVLHYELKRDSRYKNELSLLFCDIDYFKNINDQYGHKVGDEVLKEFTGLVTKNIRKTDIVARWGGEEFAFLLPETNLDIAILMAEKIRGKIETHAFNTVGSITASFGVTQCIDGDTETSLICRADKALYTCKENGRNRVEAMRPEKILSL